MTPVYPLKVANGDTLVSGAHFWALEGYSVIARWPEALWLDRDGLVNIVSCGRSYLAALVHASEASAVEALRAKLRHDLKTKVDEAHAILEIINKTQKEPTDGT